MAAQIHNKNEPMPNKVKSIQEKIKEILQELENIYKIKKKCGCKTHR